VHVIWIQVSFGITKTHRASNKVTQMSSDFHTAAERAEAQIGASAWNFLGIHERADAIYEQLRVLDAERAHLVSPQPVH
jgi:hypothetical protein